VKNNQLAAMKKLWFVVVIFTGFSVASASESGLELKDGWHADIITECAEDLPDMLLLSADGQHLYQSCETRANMLSPSLARIEIKSGKREILIYGLGRADGMRFAPDGSLWLGEEQPDGLIWKIDNPDLLKAEQRADRYNFQSSSKHIRATTNAGVFAHEGLTFSADGKYLYLADEWKEGCLYRYDIQAQVLKVFHAKKGWLTIKRPEDARIEAERLHGTWYNRMEDMELMPDGRILITETGTGNILVLTDVGEQPEVKKFLFHPDIKHPDNLEWDAKRNWLWITDDSDDSELWAWDGKSFALIASHTSAEITGIESAADGTIYFNLQHRRFAPDLTIRMQQK